MARTLLVIGGSGGGGGSGAGQIGPFQRTLLLKNTTTGEDRSDHIVFYGAKPGESSTITRVVMVLKKAITADLVVKLNIRYADTDHEIGTFTVPSDTAVDTPLKFTTFVSSQCPDVSVLWAGIDASDGQKESDGVASLTIFWYGRSSGQQSADGIIHQNEWLDETVYAKNDSVIFDGSSYFSLVSGNVGNQPDTSPTFWSLYAAQGGTGPPGTSGTSGTNATGFTSGTSGSSGVAGTSGSAGSSGTRGTSGTSGTSGAAGTSGTNSPGLTSGTSGLTGSSGTAGTSGTNAPGLTSGTTGSAGTSGSSGTSGTTGSAGTSGTRGTSGSSGITFTPSDTVLLSGGAVVWVSGYTFNVSAATYLILGVAWASPFTTVTLTAPHATLDRIDMIVVDDTGSVVVIEGDLSSTPKRPNVDPAHQLTLTFILVVHATSSPIGVTNALIYDENVEWSTSTSGTGWTTASTNFPYTGTKDVEATAVAKTSYVQFQSGTAIDLSLYANLVLYIRSKGAWSNQRYLTLTWLSAGVAVGLSVTLKETSYTFNSSNTVAYQQIVVPLIAGFGPIGGTITQLRIAVGGGGGSATIGFYLDNIFLQVGVIPPDAPATSGTSGTSAAGTSGTSGTSSLGFTSGTSGTRGTSGTSGVAGSSGTSGTGSGTGGSGGTSGTSGTSALGSSGSAGSSGTSGTSGGGSGTGGSAGTSGTSGTSGGAVAPVVGIQMYTAAGWTSGASGVDKFYAPDTVDFDTAGGTLWNVAHPTRFIATSAGVWTMRATFYSSAAWDTAVITFHVNGGSTVYRSEKTITGSATFNSLQGERTFNLAANDYVEAVLFVLTQVTINGGPENSSVTWVKESSFGTSGTSGTGAVGSSGTSGTSALGSSGSAGTSGTSGTSGVDGGTGGTPNVHDEPLTDGNGNFIFADGDIIVVVGVPN